MNPGTKAISIVAIALFLWLSSPQPDGSWGQSKRQLWSVAPVDHSTVRLHVIADSKRSASQSFKMDLVKNCKACSPKIDPAGLTAILYYILKRIRKSWSSSCKSMPVRAGRPGPVSVSLARERFPCVLTAASFIARRI